MWVSSEREPDADHEYFVYSSSEACDEDAIEARAMSFSERGEEVTARAVSSYTGDIKDDSADCFGDVEGEALGV